MTDYQKVSMHADLLNQGSLDDPKLLLLIEADMKISSVSGENVGYDKRPEEIKAKHGADSRAYGLCSRNVRFLRAIGRE